MADWFVGIGIDEYEDMSPLVNAISDVTGVSGQLRPTFDGEPLANPTEQAVSAHLKALPAKPVHSLVLMWAGHGDASRGQLQLHTTDRGGRLLVADVVDRCLASGASQLLFIIDACYAGSGLINAMKIATAVLDAYRPNADRVWCGVLASCRSAERANDGLFGSELQRLLREGPKDHELRRRWSPFNELISGADLGEAILRDWPDDQAQEPAFLRSGDASFMLPNPLWRPGAPQQVVEHLLRAARAGDEPVSWFTGRAAEVNAVVSWVTAGMPGLRVVTGSAGTGKSAILGRVVSLADPTERPRLGDPGRWAHADPGPNAVDAHIHARGLTDDQAAELLEDQLIRPGRSAAYLRPLEYRRNALELVGALQRAVKAGMRPPVIIVDGLDEARDEALSIGEDLLARLAPYANVIVSTRPVTGARKTPSILPAQSISILEVLAPVAILNLDDHEHRNSQWDAIGAYLSRRLDGRSPLMDPVAVAAAVTERASQDGEPFLLARIIADQLSNEPLDTTTPGWQDRLAASISDAFDRDLGQVGDPGVALPGGADAVQLARQMLVALTWALGAGFPAHEWLAVAGALAGQPLNSEHIDWALGQLGRYVVEDGQNGVAVYRMAHQSLADHLRQPHIPIHDQPFDPAAGPVWLALADRYRELLARPHTDYDLIYLLRYIGKHAAAAGLAGVAELGHIAAVAEVPAVALADANLTVALHLLSAGRPEEAIQPAHVAVNTYSTPSDPGPSDRHELGIAWMTLGRTHRDTGHAVEAVAALGESVQVLQDLTADQSAYRSTFAVSLTLLGRACGEAGDLASAQLRIAQAVATWRLLVDTDPAKRRMLALALSFCADMYTTVDEPKRAIPLFEESLAVWRALTDDHGDDPGLAGDTAMSLAGCYLRMDRYEEAAGLYHEAAQYLRGSTDARAQRVLAVTLSSLAMCHMHLERYAEAVRCYAEAVPTWRGVIAADPSGSDRELLADALGLLGMAHRKLGQFADAAVAYRDEAAEWRSVSRAGSDHVEDLLGAMRSAADCYRALPYRDRHQQSMFVVLLRDLGVQYMLVDQPLAAIEALTDAAVSLEATGGSGPAHDTFLATVSDALGRCYLMLDRHETAITILENAAQLWRALHASGHADEQSLTDTLDVLHEAHEQSGQSEAVADALSQSTPEVRES